MNSLNEVWQKISTRLYQDQDQSQNESTQAHSDTQKSNESDISDVDYEEVK